MTTTIPELASLSRGDRNELFAKKVLGWIPPWVGSGYWLEHGDNGRTHSVSEVANLHDTGNLGVAWVAAEAMQHGGWRVELDNNNFAVCWRGPADDPDESHGVQGNSPTAALIDALLLARGLVR